ncbi:MAG: hypothetical protein ACPGKS_04080 [Coraliomargarita sp.]
MAVLWRRNIEGNLYEVRSAGATLRLFRNGVHHSQFNPNRPLGGCIWDLLALPALHRPAGSINQALILGFGAGALGRVLKEVVQPERIVGVELDEIHLTIADGFFECSEGCELIAADAVAWARDGAEGGSFDFILDDLYSEEAGMPIRCAPLDLDWCRTLSGLANPGGMLVFNLVEPEKIPYLPPLKNRELRKRFKYVKVFSMSGYENRIVAFSELPLESERLRENLLEVGRAHPACYGIGKRYRTDVLRDGK